MSGTAGLVEGLLCLCSSSQSSSLLPPCERSSVLHSGDILAQTAPLVVHPCLALLGGVPPVAGEGASAASLLAGHGVVDPADSLRNRGVDSGGVVLATANSPGHDAGLDVGIGVILAGTDQRAASVSLAGVLPINSSSTDEGVIKLEPLAQPGGPQRHLTLIMAHHRQVDLLQDHLILPGGSKLVLSPSRGETVVSFKLFIRLRKAHGVNVLLELEVLAGVQNSPVVGEVPWVELRVDVEGIDIPVLVGPRLGLVLGVPLPTPNLQLSRSILELGSAVGSGEDDPRGDEGATTLVEVDGLRLTSIAGILGNWLLGKDGAHVRPLSKLGLVLLESLDPHSQAVLVPLSTLGCVLDLGWWGRGHKVRVETADIKEARALAVLRAEDAEAISDVNETASVSDDGAVVALVVGHTLVPLGCGVVGAVLEDIVHTGGGLVGESISSLVVVRCDIAVFILHHLDNGLDATGY